MGWGVREPAVAGYFYPSTREGLISEIERCFRSELGPGDIPSRIGSERKLVGLVSPHAGYVYSGPVAAHGYRFMAEDGLPQTVVILGPNHTGMGSGVSIYARGAWKTPLGVVDVDSELADVIVKSSTIIDIDQLAHRSEHSVEVQVPFLQYIYGKAGASLRIVPIVLMMQDINTAMEVGKAIYDAASSLGRDIVIVASSDFTHYEPHSRAVEKDRIAIDRILALDPPGLIKEVYARDISMCGFGPVAAMLHAAKLMGASKATLLKYATSGDVTGDRSSVVGYASIAVTR